MVNCQQLTIRVPGVVIKNSRINGNIWMDQDFTPSGSFTLTDSEVDAGKYQVPAICCGNYTVIRVNSHGGQNGGQCENGATYCIVRDSYLHGQYVPPGGNWHLGGFLSDGGTPGQLIHNTVACDRPAENDDGSCTGDINLIPNFGTMSDWLVEGNFLKASSDLSFCTYGGEKSTSAYPHGDHVVYRDNVFERGPNRKCGAYGPVTGFNVGGVGNVWTGNVWDDGTPVQPAN